MAIVYINCSKFYGNQAIKHFNRKGIKKMVLGETQYL